MTSQSHTGIAAPGTRQDAVAEGLPLLRDNRTLSALWQAWQALYEVAGRAVPRKENLRMQAVKSILPALIISEREEPGLIRIRLAGSLVDEMLGGALTGANTLDLSPTGQRAAIERVYNHIAGTPCGFYISETLLLADGKVSHLDALILPMTGAREDRPRFFIGAYHFGDWGYDLCSAEMAKVEHRMIERFGYLDIGYGLPD